jgi:hypothetical protein
VTRIAILDDYIGVALEYGDWNALPPDAEVTVYREAIPPERLIEELVDYEIVVITRQRARFLEHGARPSPRSCLSTSTDTVLRDGIGSSLCPYLRAR